MPGSVFQVNEKESGIYKKYENDIRNIVEKLSKTEQQLISALLLVVK